MLKWVFPILAAIALIVGLRGQSPGWLLWVSIAMGVALKLSLKKSWIFALGTGLVFYNFISFGFHLKVANSALLVVGASLIALLLCLKFKFRKSSLLLIATVSLGLQVSSFRPLFSEPLGMDLDFRNVSGAYKVLTRGVRATLVGWQGVRFTELLHRDFNFVGQLYMSSPDEESLRIWTPLLIERSYAQLFSNQSKLTDQIEKVGTDFSGGLWEAVRVNGSVAKFELKGGQEQWTHLPVLVSPGVSYGAENAEVEISDSGILKARPTGEGAVISVFPSSKWSFAIVCFWLGSFGALAAAAVSFWVDRARSAS